MILVWKRSSGSTDRGQSEVIGVVLLLAVTVIGVTIMGATGAAMLGDAQSDSRVAQTQNSMAQLSSKAGLVALGESESQSFNLGTVNDGTVEVRENVGHVTVYKENETDSEVLYNESYGAVVATVGDTEIAYQGGGVWKRDGDRSVMASPPEFYYRSNTLTFPIVRVTGEGRASGAVTGQFTNVSESGSIYPNASNEYTNPLEEGTVIVEIRSDYYDAWARFFEDRTTGDVEMDHENRTARIELTVPAEKEIENVVAVSTPNGITTNGGDKPNPYREGIQYPSASPMIENRVTECTESGTDCTEVTNETTIRGDASKEETRYYATGEGIPDDLTVQTDGGNVTLVVDGGFDPENVEIEGDGDVSLVVDGVFEPGSLSIRGDGNVSVYVTEGFSLSGDTNINPTGESSQLIVYVHSDGSNTDSSQQGNPSFTGVLYAPNTDVELSGNTDFGAR
ncbi:hypothetical protein HAPAU_23440 [Halalkalicoccus paucihalophilus]|uniref:DUF7305 domain-containing protein n=1 Tax=Halalkalicoccus paucihalophilus TaxID=1008153 RepID=A0A151ADE8_9EURY|nr:hypothetical protein HAPAU_23440 [Halalkalicoccus paucihalophilus]